MKKSSRDRRVFRRLERRLQPFPLQLIADKDGRTIVISTYFECLAVHSAGKSINITPNNFIAVNVWELGLYNDQH